MKQHIFVFLKDENGASIVEYALLIGLVAVVAIGALTTLGSTIKEKFTALGDSLQG